MTNNEVLTSNTATLDSELESKLDNNEIVAPTKWRYDKKEGKLYMMFKEGIKTYLLIARAVLDDNRGLFRTATLENGREVLLWTSNRTGAL
jgi:hypothetical protein